MLKWLQIGWSRIRKDEHHSRALDAVEDPDEGIPRSGGVRTEIRRYDDRFDRISRRNIRRMNGQYGACRAPNDVLCRASQEEVLESQ